MTEEVPLEGGMVTSSVVRVGNTVRRPTARWSPAVHELLRHLEAVGFDGAPRFLGLDESGREVLTWIDGAPARRPWPDALLTDDGVRKVARFLRRYHDAVTTFEPPEDAVWWTGPGTPRAGEVILHGDLGPWNMLAQQGDRFIDEPSPVDAVPRVDALRPQRRGSFYVDGPIVLDGVLEPFLSYPRRSLMSCRCGREELVCRWVTA